MRTAWFLNLDAEEELAHPRGWSRSPGLWLATQSAREAAGRALVSKGDTVVEPGDRLRGPWRGRAWCPTPGALEVLISAGADPAPCPRREILARVNERRFLVELGLAAVGTHLVQDAHGWAQLVSGPRDSSLRLKRMFGAAGRGQMTLLKGSSGSELDAWVRRGLALGGVLVEPELEVEQEVVTHGVVTDGGELHLGQSRLQEVSPGGAWRYTGAPVPVPESFRDAARRAGEGLVEAGYFGPFGLDGLISSDGRAHPASDLNARFTMGWVDPRV